MAVEIHDVLIIGAGPAGLAVAARLRESTPSAVFTDAEHSRYQWIKKHSGRMNIRSSKTAGSEPQTRRPGLGNASKIPSNSDLDIKVLDGSGDTWLHSWKSNFSALSISHLRSPMFFHPCPRDRDGLLAFAHEVGAADKCIEIANCVGKSMSKHRRKRKVANGCSVGCSTARAPLEIDERDRKDYYVPSAETFHGFCDEIVQRYGLESLVEKARVVAIEYDFPDALGLHDFGGQINERLFKIRTSCGQVRHAKVAVLAVGAGGSPNMPRKLSPAEGEGATHSTEIPKKGLLPTYLRKKILARCLTSVMIVGAGLTGAQIADECITSGVSRVVMVMRSGLKLKPFDVDLQWMAKYRNGEKAAFWSADSDEERLEMLLKARNGGSITPRFFKKLQTHLKSGILSIHTDTSMTSSSWDTMTKTWEINVQPLIQGCPTSFDHIFFATGVATDFRQLPYLSPLRENFPVKVTGGMPCLTDDLAWTHDVPLFVAGKLAGLRIGPDCGNLEGARVGAERIAWGIQEVLEQQKGTRTGGESRHGGEDEHWRICQRVGSLNMYEALTEGGQG